jgi:hypothetical protein
MPLIISINKEHIYKNDMLIDEEPSYLKMILPLMDNKLIKIF